MRNVGSIIGSIGGLVFVLLNAGAVPDSTLWRIAGVVVFLAVAGFVLARGTTAKPVVPSRSALRMYGIAVTAMVAAIIAGAALLSRVFDKPNLVLPWVVLAVGAHFWPFAKAFQLPVFRWLSGTLIAVAVVGGIFTLVTASAAAAGWTGVAAGFVLLFYAALGAYLSRVRAPA